MEQSTTEQPRKNTAAEESKNFSFKDTARMPERFASLNRVITRDLNGTYNSPTFYLYTKDDINEFLQNPYTNQKNLRNAAIYLYGASSHFRRLIQYFTGLTDLSYVISPSGIDTSTAKPKTIGQRYRKVQKLMTALDVRTQFPKIITVCLREDVYYGGNPC